MANIKIENFMYFQNDKHNENKVGVVVFILDKLAKV
jgi:hypothetical protein